MQDKRILVSFDSMLYTRTYVFLLTITAVCKSIEGIQTYFTLKLTKNLSLHLQEYQPHTYDFIYLILQHLNLMILLYCKNLFRYIECFWQFDFYGLLFFSPRALHFYAGKGRYY